VTNAGQMLGLRDTLRETVRTWLRGDSIQWGAALSYYALFSLGPLLLLSVGFLGLVLDADAAGATIVRELTTLIGERAARVAETILREGSFPSFDSIEALGSALLLLVAATAVFVNLRRALNAVWSVRPIAGPVITMIRIRLTAFLIVLVLGVLIAVSVLLGAGAAYFAPVLERAFPYGGLLGRLLESAISLAVLWVGFSLIFRVLPDAKIAWRDAGLGGLVTAFLFTAGKLLIGIYLTRSDLGSAFGAAGSVFLFLIWLYYSAQIFLLGATFTAVWARARGREIEPEDHAARVEEQVLDPHEDSSSAVGT